MRKSVAGFSLIEVLVALSVFSLGMLSVLELQVKASTYAGQAKYAQAAHLLALDLRGIYQYQLLKQANEGATANDLLLPTKTLGGNLPIATCAADIGSIEVQLSCWQERMFRQLPSAEQVFAEYAYICQSDEPGRCSATGDALEIQLAWTATNSLCSVVSPLDSGQQLCLYRARIEL
ncbi:type IV pilus modification protein PilV [Thiopseudomonas alkaliphila]|uniref:Type IV pilus modification protein PilV n=1 Tax=Thiopseudomonas alkaliphila TaxID=1697053 RepID=A0A0K1XDL0_9GAMM|nr:type IV pilus modification protein PilV [Thiopseudomonas alkaliphila]AKX59247.1 hypothetical protein AKN88_04320 [Thiopseudomonas alkaliphila]MDM1716333.1 type IV pilus modification protein PilV [Thiopseudomonas alkaliphila]